LNINLSIFEKLRRATFSKNRKNGFGGRPPSARAPPQPPKNFQRPILLASQSPTRISKNFDSSYYSPRDIAGLKQVIGNFFSFTKSRYLKCHSLDYQAHIGNKVMG